MESYYQRNKERLLAYQRAYHHAHKEQCHAYAAYYYQTVTKFVREAKPRTPRVKKEKVCKTTIRYNSGTVTEKKIRLRKPVQEPPPPPAPGPAVVAWDGIYLDWNNL